jgi:DNA-binding NarL/FixJ family response regulator
MSSKNTFFNPNSPFFTFFKLRNIMKTGTLTAREIEVLQLIAKGETTLVIAKKLFISPETSKMRMKTLREKLEAATAAEAVYKAMKMELLA